MILFVHKVQWFVLVAINSKGDTVVHKIHHCRADATNHAETVFSLCEYSRLPELHNIHLRKIHKKRIAFGDEFVGDEDCKTYTEDDNEETEGEQRVDSSHFDAMGLFIFNSKQIYFSYLRKRKSESQVGHQ